MDRCELPIASTSLSHPEKWPTILPEGRMDNLIQTTSEAEPSVAHVQAEIRSLGTAFTIGPREYINFASTDMVCFVESGLIVEIARNKDGREAAIRCVGRKGVIWPDLGQYTTLRPRAYCVISVNAIAVPRQALPADQPDQRNLLTEYSKAMFCDVSSNLLDAAHLTLEPRLARWLLTCFERSGEETLPLTHEMLSRFLGVRRASITLALHVIEGERAIKAMRGCITLKNKCKLRNIALLDS